MKNFQFAILVGVIALCSTAHAAAPHSVTYSQVSVAPGTIIELGGEPFVAVQVPVRQFTTDKRYAVRFLSPLYPDVDGDSVFATLNTAHSTDPLQDSNATIDTFPARIEVSDGRDYSVTTITDFQTFTQTNMLHVEGHASVLVRVQVGDTLLNLYGHLSRTDQEVDLGPEEYRGTAQAAFGKYVDPVGLVGQTSGLDKWVDFIRVIPLN